MRKIWATEHCIDRYQEYCNDAEDRKVVLTSLLSHFRRGRVVETPPSWVSAKRPNQIYLMVGENMVFPLVEENDSYVAITCLHRRWAEKRKRQELLSW
jgi:hypothetical protein